MDAPGAKTILQPATQFLAAHDRGQGGHHRRQRLLIDLDELGSIALRLNRTALHPRHCPALDPEGTREQVGDMHLIGFRNQDRHPLALQVGHHLPKPARQRRR